jgi:hypothetical protein
MANIAEDYVSPSLRWGIFKEDHPEASVEFSSVKGTTLGIPKDFGGAEDYCLATINRYPGDKSPITGYKPTADTKGIRGDHTSDVWNILCTKALGRAIKRGGYPDTTEDLKVFVLYKQRMAEQEAIRGGITPEPSKVIAAPAGIVTGEIVETKETIEPDVPAEIVDAVVAEIAEAFDAEEVTFEEAELVATSDAWDDAFAMDEAHDILKATVAGLPEEWRQQAREAHQKINGRQWPMESVSQFLAVSRAIADVETEYKATV